MGLKEFKQINFYSPWNHQKTYGFLMISGEREVNLFAKIHLILEAKSEDDLWVEISDQGSGANPKCN